MKSIMLAVLAAGLTLSAAYAKSYRITLTEPVKAGTVDLKAGDYQVKVEGTTAIFQDMDHDRKYSVPVKVEANTEKHDQTTVETSTETGTARIKAIEFGGSHETLEFSD